MIIIYLYKTELLNFTKKEIKKMRELKSIKNLYSTASIFFFSGLFLLLLDQTCYGYYGDEKEKKNDGQADGQRQR